MHIAYQVVGDGERDVLFVPGLMSHVELAWEDPGTVAFYRRLASLGRLILFDKRDTGLSDRAPGDSSLEERIEDVQAVMTAASSDRAVVFGYSEGAPMSILFTATYPEKVSSLILGSAFARWFPGAGLPVWARRGGGVRGDGRDRNAPMGPGRHDRLVSPQPLKLAPDTSGRSPGLSGWRSARARTCA